MAATTARQRRLLLEQALDRLLGAVDGLLADLDALDGDPDLEPAMGSQNPHPYVSQLRWAAGGDTDEREAVSEGEGDHDEREPEDYHKVPTYADDGHGGQDQRRIVSPFLISGAPL